MTLGFGARVTEGHAPQLARQLIAMKALKAPSHSPAQATRHAYRARRPERPARGYHPYLRLSTPRTVHQRRRTCLRTRAGLCSAHARKQPNAYPFAHTHRHTHTHPSMCRCAELHTRARMCAQIRARSHGAHIRVHARTQKTHARTNSRMHAHKQMYVRTRKLTRQYAHARTHE